ncbi:hypothetical protein MMYC01_204241 [Madurella mycetomatis]|uniref:Uncharacterized protein n=1 Tax=Madurella mycetomatis TaxID=100816 RepID=A0A175W9C4_9PEZI|nr:hypothetical protein MMYC01_204241 [Madurella mycetomatis]
MDGPPPTAASQRQGWSNGLLATPSELRLGGSQAMFDDPTLEISSRSLYEPSSPPAAETKQSPTNNINVLSRELERNDAAVRNLWQKYQNQRRRPKPEPRNTPRDLDRSADAVPDGQRTDPGESQAIFGDLQGGSAPRIVVSELVDGWSESAGTVNDSCSGNITPRTITPRTSSPGSLSGSPRLQPADAPPRLMNGVMALDRELERNDMVVCSLMQKHNRRRSPKPETKRLRDSPRDPGGQDPALEVKTEVSGVTREIFRLTTALKEAELSYIEVKNKFHGELEELRLRHDRDQNTIQELRGELDKLRELYWDMSYDYRDLQEDFVVLQAKVDTSIPIDDGNDRAGLSRLVQKTPREVRQERKIHELTQKLKQWERQAREGA